MKLRDVCTHGLWDPHSISFAGGTGHCKGGRVVGGLVSTAEIAQRLRVKKETVHAWRYRGILPEPDFDLAVGPVWLWSTIEGWARGTGRLK